MYLSKKAQKMSGSATMKAAAYARALQDQGVDVIRLDVGEPDFETPPHIKAAGMEAIQSGATRYTPMRGHPKTILAIQKKLEEENSLAVTTEQICVSNGAKQAIYNLLMSVLDNKDEVLIPAPYWTSYPEMVSIVGGKPKIIQTAPERKFKLSAEDLQNAITEKTKLLILNSPCNPTGSVYDKYELESLAEVLKQHPQVMLCLDEVYEHIIYSDESSHATNLLNVAPELSERTVAVYSLSKSYAMTGWRLGYAVGPRDIISAMVKFQSQISGCASSLAQRACIDALSKQSTQSIHDMMAKYSTRLDVCQNRLDQIPDIHYIPSDGSFYLFLNVEGLVKKLSFESTDALCQALLQEAHVSLVPGSAFGAPQYIRLSFAVSKTKLHLAFDRIQDFIQKHHGHSIPDETL